jgi:hypothetical protein
VRGWSRIVAFVAPILALAAAALPGGRGWLAGLVAAAAIGEVARFRQTEWWSLEEPADVVAARAAGDVPILLPLDGIERTRRWVEGPTRPDVWKVMPDHDLFKYFQDALPNEPELFRATSHGVRGTYNPCLLLADAVALRGIGFRRIYLRKDFLPHDGAGMAARALKAVFGAPREDNLWILPERVSAECAGTEGAEVTLAVGGGDRPDAQAVPRTPEERAKLREARRAERDRVRADRVRQHQERLRDDP